MPRLPPAVTAALSGPTAPRLVAALVAAAVVLGNLDAPLVEDSLFWWVPKALLAAEVGPQATFAHVLPDAIAAPLTPETTPPQWAGGLPDYAHPVLWYLWMALFLSVSQTVEAVHLACLLPAVVAAVGLVELGGRLGNRWAGLAALCLPPVLVQFLRPELDLPLLAIVPWAMVALLDGNWVVFAILGFLAPWMKEPGVLLAAPAVVRAFRERRLEWRALTPLLGLGAWGLVHGGLAQPERLPTTVLDWLTRDLWLAVRIVLLEQGRWLLLLAIPLTWRRWRGPAPLVTGSLVVVWVGFFATIGFFAASGAAELNTHVRYFVPGMAVAAVLLCVRWPFLALPGLIWLYARSPFGPEASHFGLDAARTEHAAAPWLAAQLDAGQRVWVGSYQAAGLTQPWAGIVDEPVTGFRVYSMDTHPTELEAGDLVALAAYGEPAGRLERGLTWEEAEAWTHRDATLRVVRVTGHRQPGAVQGPATPPPPGPVPPPAPPR